MGQPAVQGQARIKQRIETIIVSRAVESAGAVGVQAAVAADGTGAVLARVVGEDGVGERRVPVGQVDHTPAQLSRGLVTGWPFAGGSRAGWSRPDLGPRFRDDDDRLERRGRLEAGGGLVSQWTVAGCFRGESNH